MIFDGCWHRSTIRVETVAVRGTREQIASMHTFPMRYAAVASGLLIAAGSLRAQQASDARLGRAKAAVDRIRTDDIVRDVSYLASDANMGRRTPFPGLASPGYDSAAAFTNQWIAEKGL